ncbi:hypothetical protein, unlikely [Trypanosoma brucei gambiense DAL972]|uniref:Uncharacterized protein n=1 Tax=Trypanosoma brucei gambiense (strain MHOM/CI/86/DAL972) TaxID=679716 RepID=D0A917_TRYB9|nr:hypothetical protein, unlikely [Trypanosoma brucei gambiense DAL972]CBH18168.1 hypothetical protein, unlikely [Trypanosoma brucei gambiense DAL972]|eukprot:XP_011780432.1 hypothetical protein, unlikely [Trypanosoma brucei gambiense DAL972]
MPPPSVPSVPGSAAAQLQGSVEQINEQTTRVGSSGRPNGKNNLRTREQTRNGAHHQEKKRGKKHVSCVPLSVKEKTKREGPSIQPITGVVSPSISLIIR